MQTQTVRVEGIPMRWAEQGQGTPVVLLHGIPTSPALWRHVMPLVSGVRLLAWEMVGYGESIPEGRDRDIRLATQARYLRWWLRAMEIDRAIFVGHDLGGGVAQIACVNDPHLCAGLVLTNSIGYDSWPIPAVRALRAASPLTARMPDRVLKANLALLLYRGHDDRSVARESLDVHFAPYARYDGGRALARQVRALDVRDTLSIQHALSSVRGRPVRVVWGAADRFQKVRYGERLATDLGGSLKRIPRGKHFVPEDHPGEIASAIEEVRREVQAQQVSVHASP